MQALFIQLDDTNQRVANLQEHVFRQEEPQAQRFATQPVDVPIPTGEPQFQTPQATLHGPATQEPWPQLHLPQTRLPPVQRPQTAQQQEPQGAAQSEQLPNLPRIRRVPQMRQQQNWQIPVAPHFIPQQPLSPIPRPEERVGTLTREEVRQMIANQLRPSEPGIFQKMGRPYPAEYDAVPYPPGYTVPKFKSFNGIGNPIQHLAHFVATCGNTGSNDALLLRQFSQSLTGVAFKWYYSLENGLVRTWVEMENTFASKFASISDTVDITTLVNTKMKKDKSPVDYITRWRNLSIRCEHPLDQAYAVDTVIANIDNWMSPFLRSNKPRTFQELITQVARLEKSKVQSTPAQHSLPRFKKEEAKVVHAKTTKK